MIAIIDYGVGNLFSLSSSLTHLQIPHEITASAAALEKADGIILPGVGAFGDAMDKLRATQLIPVLQKQVQAGKPLLGICLGMQLLFQKSEEYGTHEGLGFIQGSVQPLQPALEKADFTYKVPHMGWNALHLTQPQNPLLKNTREGECVYFVHSFYACDCQNSLAASAEYGVTVPATVAAGNVFGCQFHPEKSGETGLRILRAFADLCAPRTQA